MSEYSGSTGYTSAARIRSLINYFVSLDSSRQTSVVFASLWSSRAVKWMEPELPYFIESSFYGGFTNDPGGWLKLLQTEHGSTMNTSSQSTGDLAGLGLPSSVYTQFVADIAFLNGLTTANDGVTDAAQGRRCYAFLGSPSLTAAEQNRYRPGGHYQELLCAWAAVGSSGAPTS